jgi:tetratricopeptide (TPR) repeat protein
MMPHAGSCSVLASVTVVLLGLGAAATVHAQHEPESATEEPTRQVPREAIELYQRAREAYRHGRYADAALNLERALVLDPGSPTLLYNLARVYELLGELERAIGAYRQYLRVIPETDTAERERTEAAIIRLQGAQTYQRPDEGVYSQPLYVTQRGVADELFWATLVGGGVVTLAAVLVGLIAAAMDADAAGFRLGRDGDARSWQERIDAVRTLAVAADVVGVVGGATLVGAFLLWVLREQTVELYPEARRTPVASWGPGPGELGMGVGLRW